MKNIMIKVFVVVIGLLAYTSISFMIDANRQDEEIARLKNTIVDLEELHEQLEQDILDLENGNLENEEVAGCLKLYEITINIKNENEDFNQTVTHCTNESTLGDALDEMIVELSIIYDPNYTKDYIYGRMVHSFHGFGKDFEEYYAITIDEEYAGYGIDFIVLEDGIEYGFTLTRWS